MRLLLPLLFLVLAVPAAGNEIGAAYGGLPIAGVEFEGVPEGLESPLRSGLAVTGKRGFFGLRDLIFEPGMITADIQRIEFFLAREGYPYATADADLEANGETTQIRIRFVIDPGEPVRIGKLEFVDVGTTTPLSEKNQKDLRIAVGEIFTDHAAERARGKVLNYLLERGYARAKVEVEVEAMDRRTVAVRFTGERGRKWNFGTVRVNGVPDEFQAVVRRAANIPEGRPFHPRVVRDATEDIRGLRLFRQVQASLDAADSNTLDLVYDLSERDHRSVEFGVGYLSDDGLLGTAMWEHRNLFHAGRGFRVYGSATQYEQLLEASVRFPALFRSPTTGIGSVGWERRVEPAYESTDLRASFYFNYRYTRQGQITTGPLLQIIDVQETAVDPEIPQEIAEADGPIWSWVGDWAYDNSDDPIFPTRGWRLTWDNQLAPPGLGSISQFYRTEMSAALYRKIAPGTILAARVSNGIGWPLEGSAALLINYRFFAGGSTSHRGYRRDRLGPKDANNNPQGGEYSLLAGLELRFPFWKVFEGALFADGGQVWASKREVRVRALSYAVGPGLAIRTPVGPIRFDYGIRVNPPDDGEPNQVLHFAIGYAF